MSEIERYNGLTTADKGALLDAKARGAEWVARDSEDQANELMAYYCKPKKHSELGVWLVDQDDILRSSIFLFVNDMPFVQWSDAEPVNIDLAIAQIAEMESAEKPLTWNERINQMTVEEKARWMLNRGTEMHNESAKYAWDNASHKFEEMYLKRMTDFLNSPYTEGENHEG